MAYFRTVKMNRLIAAIWTITATGASAQAPAAVGPAFEDASIRQSSPLLQAAADGSLVGMVIGQGHVSIGHTPLMKLIGLAFNIKNYQLAGPDWLTSPDPNRDGFDIEARLPAEATPDQVPLMLQALLADRFKLTIRRGSRESDTYALIVAKGGPKFQAQESVAEPASPPISESRISVSQGPKGETIMSLGAAKVITIPGIGTRVETTTIQGLVDYLSSRLPEPVVDKTGLRTNFNIKMEIPPADIKGLLAGKDGTPADPGALREALLAPLFPAVETLGLRLERQKGPIETIIVEHIEKTPTEN